MPLPRMSKKKIPWTRPEKKIKIKNKNDLLSDGNYNVKKVKERVQEIFVFVLWAR